jgi:hypothetical protein
MSNLSTVFQNPDAT